MREDYSKFGVRLNANRRKQSMHIPLTEVEADLGRKLNEHERRPGPFWQNGWHYIGGEVTRRGWQVRNVDPNLGLVYLERLPPQGR
ncbi:MAG: hypothetical protein JOY71_24135 [Acetobacteraceae bacterium]|nr:hypothetical protein [Acetobacteraceae bacterium]